MLSTVFQSSVLADLQGPYGIYSAEVFDLPIMQVEFGKCTHISGHKIIDESTGDPAPLQWLRPKVRYAVGYFLPACTATAWQLGDYTTGKTHDPYYARREYRKACEANDWYMKGSDGKPLIWSSYNMPVVDLGIDAAWQWVVDMLMSYDLDAYMLDTMFLHFKGYIPGLDGYKNQRLTQGYQKIGQTLRHQGKKVLGNGAWEMNDPMGDWYTPYAVQGAVDAVMVEWPCGFTYDGEWWAVTEQRFVDICQHLAQYDVGVLLYSKYVEEPGRYNSSPFATRELHDHYFGQLASSQGAGLALGENTNRTWYELYMEQWRWPATPPPEPPTPPPSEDLELRVALLEAQMDRLQDALCMSPGS